VDMGKVGGVVCACVLKPQAMKECVSVYVLRCVHVLACVC